MLISDMSEVHQALNAGAVTLHTKIISRVPQTDEKGKQYMKRYETTPGRMLLGETLPKSHKVPFETVNRLLTKKDVGDVIDEVYRHTGQKETVLFADAIMALGFRHAFKAGISFGKDDMIIPDATRSRWSTRPRRLVKDFEQQYQDGLITQQEKYNKVIDAWSRCGDQVANAMMNEIKAVKTDPETGREKPINSIYMMAHSGARGSQAQIKQLAGMRGLMAKPSGEIIETPIISNFKEGLTVLEYFNSTHGARKGLADTALKTANSGYLTRRLVDVSQDCVIIEEDCGTERALEMKAIVQGGIDHRVARRAHPGPHHGRGRGRPKTGKVVIPSGTLLDEPMIAQIEAIGIQGMKIRSPLVCESEDRRVRQVLRARSRPRYAGQHRRSGRRHRGAVDRRAGHAADDADLPHRRRGAAQRDVEPGGACRRHGRVPRPARHRRPARPPRGAQPFGRARDRRHGRPRARGRTASRTARTCMFDDGHIVSQGRPDGRMGSVHHAGDHREPAAR